MAFKVLYVHDSGRIGGAGNVLLHLLCGLDQQAFFPQVICGSKGPLVERLRSLGFPVEIVNFFRPKAIGDREGFWLPQFRPLWWNGQRLWSSVRQLRAFLHNTDYDLVHTNGLVSNLVTSIAMIGEHKPLIWHEHGIQPAGFRRLVYSSFANLFPRRIIAVSNAVRETYTPYLLNKGKITTIYNGLDPESIDEKSAQQPIREELKVGKEANVVVMASLLMPWKGHEWFIRAAKLLQHKHPESYFLILGSTGKNSGQQEYKEHLLALTEQLEMTGRVRFLGFRHDVFSIFRQANVVVSSSVQPDPFPTVILEAMHAGRPVVATAIGGQIEMVQDGETGLLVPPADAEALSQAIDYLLSHPKEARIMGERGNSRVKTRFSLNRFAASVWVIYRELLE